MGTGKRHKTWGKNKDIKKSNGQGSLLDFHNESKEGESSFSSKVDDVINEHLKDYNARDTEQVKRHLETIKQSLASEIEGSIDLRFGGSVIKHTFVNGLSDHDLLVYLNQSDLANKSPGEVFAYFEKILKKRLPNSEIKVGNLAVTVKLKCSDIEIQLLPAIKTASGIRIADPNTGKWSNVVHPERFARELTTVNQQNNGKVVPIVKLVKPIIASLPRDQQISGYHIEALATEMFKNYQGAKTEKEMLPWFFKQASRRILYPVEEHTGQSEYVDDKLGPRNSDERRQLSESFATIDEKLENANQRQSIKEWRNVLG